MQPANSIHLFSLAAATRFSLSRLHHHSGAPSYFGGPQGSRLKGPPDAQGPTRGSSSADFDETLDSDDYNFFFF